MSEPIIQFSEEEHTNFSENCTSVEASMNATIFFANGKYNEQGDRLSSLSFKAGRFMDVPPNSNHQRAMDWCRLQNHNDIRFQLNKYKNGFTK